MEGVHSISETYVRAIRVAGGMPILLPPTFDGPTRDGYIALVDGLLLSGGGDVAPAHFGEDPVPGLRDVDPLRDDFELRLCRAALEADKPVLAICRGAQVLNVASGGGMVQDIATSVPGALQHTQRAPGWHASHAVDLDPTSRLASIAGSDRIFVNSFHHQSASDVVEPFRAVAKTSDGVIEAIESTRHRFAMGVQWHPEHVADHDPVAMALFERFVEEAGATRRRLPSGQDRPPLPAAADDPSA